MNRTLINRYALYLTHEKFAFAVRESGSLTTITAKDPLGNGHFSLQATLHEDDAMALSLNGKRVAEGKAASLIPQQPKVGFLVGAAFRGAVGDYSKGDSSGDRFTFSWGEGRIGLVPLDLTPRRTPGVERLLKIK